MPKKAPYREEKITSKKTLGKNGQHRFTPNDFYRDIKFDSAKETPGSFRRRKVQVEAVNLRMAPPYVDALDELCYVNNLSRRQVVEKIVRREYRALCADLTRRI